MSMNSPNSYNPAFFNDVDKREIQSEIPATKQINFSHIWLSMLLNLLNIRPRSRLFRFPTPSKEQWPGPGHFSEVMTWTGFNWPVHVDRHHKCHIFLNSWHCNETLGYIKISFWYSLTSWPLLCQFLWIVTSVAPDISCFMKKIALKYIFHLKKVCVLGT